MTDRELLEMAAKAAAYEVVGIAHRHIVQGVGEDDLLIANDRGGDSVWNPLTDDGDALRLAVKLGFSLDLGARSLEVSPHRCAVVVWSPGGRWKCLAEEPYTDDPYAATRRAIVRAAAEIGKAVQKPLAP